MQWLLTVHVRQYHREHGTSGRVWQGRFKAFPIQDDRPIEQDTGGSELKAQKPRMSPFPHFGRWSQFPRPIFLNLTLLGLDEGPWEYCERRFRQSG